MKAKERNKFCLEGGCVLAADTQWTGALRWRSFCLLCLARFGEWISSTCDSVCSLFDPWCRLRRKLSLIQPGRRGSSSYSWSGWVGLARGAVDAVMWSSFLNLTWAKLSKEIIQQLHLEVRQRRGWKKLGAAIVKGFSQHCELVSLRDATGWPSPTGTSAAVKSRSVKKAESSSCFLADDRLCRWESSSRGRAHIPDNFRPFWKSSADAEQWRGTAAAIQALQAWSGNSAGHWYFHESTQVLLWSSPGSLL